MDLAGRVAQVLDLAQEFGTSHAGRRGAIDVGERDDVPVARPKSAVGRAPDQPDSGQNGGHSTHHRR